MDNLHLSVLMNYGFSRRKHLLITLKFVDCSPIYTNIFQACLLTCALHSTFGDHLHVICYQKSRIVTKPTKWHVRPAKTQISLGIRQVWSESSPCAQWVAMDPSFLHADSEDWSDWADAQADLSLRWAHMPFCWFLSRGGSEDVRFKYCMYNVDEKAMIRNRYNRIPHRSPDTKQESNTQNIKAV